MGQREKRCCEYISHRFPASCVVISLSYRNPGRKSRLISSGMRLQNIQKKTAHPFQIQNRMGGQYQGAGLDTTWTIVLYHLSRVLYTPFAKNLIRCRIKSAGGRVHATRGATDLLQKPPIWSYFLQIIACRKSVATASENTKNAVK